MQYEHLRTLEAYVIIAKEILISLVILVLRSVRRDKARVQTEYDLGQWKKVIEKKRWLECESVRDYVIPKDKQLRVAKIQNQLVRIRTDKYYAYRLQILQDIMKACAWDEDELYELGCGWGLNLFSLSLANHWKSLIGFDISTNAIQAARRAAEHFGLDHLRFGQIDLTNGMDSSFQELRSKTVFTYHCLEQLKYSTATVIENILQSGVQSVIHIEPTTEVLKLRYPMDLVNYLYITRQDYQNNLLKTLWEFERRELIRITDQRRLYYAPTHRHDATLICWKPVA